MSSSKVFVALLVVATALAGCTESNPSPIGETDDGPDGPITPQTFSADSVIAAPTWALGDWFGHHIFFGSDDTEGNHINAVVVDKQGSDWILAPDDEEAAKWEAAWDFPMLGAIGSDLSTTAFTADWNLYDFPLEDGKTWTSTFNPLFNGPRDLTLTATFDDSIKTVGQGVKPGFRIEGVNAEGGVELRTDYMPHIGWYSELTYFDPSTEAPDDFIIRVWAMGQGHNWTGDYVTAEAISQVSHTPCFAPLNGDMTPNPTCATAAMAIGFILSEEAAELYGIMFVGAVAASSNAQLEDSTGRVQQFDALSTAPGEVDVVFEFIEDVNPPPGQWVFTWEGAGIAAFGFAQLWEIQYTTTAFPA